MNSSTRRNATLSLKKPLPHKPEPAIYSDEAFATKLDGLMHSSANKGAFYHDALFAIGQFANHAQRLEDRPEPEHTQSLLSHWQKLTGPHLSRFAYNFYPISLEGFSNLAVQPDERWMEAWHEATADKLGEFNPRIHANSLVRQTELGILPPAPWLRKWIEAAEGHVRQWDDKQLGSVIDALAHCAAAGADWLACHEAAAQLVPRLAEKQGQITAEAASYLELDAPNGAVAAPVCANPLLQGKVERAMQQAGFKGEPNKADQTPCDANANCVINGQMHRFHVVMDADTQRLHSNNGGQALRGPSLLRHALIRQDFSDNDHLILLTAQEASSPDVAQLLISKAQAALCSEPAFITEGIAHRGHAAPRISVAQPPL